MAASIWQEAFEIRSYDADFRKKASLETLCRLFQETAGNHIRALGASLETLMAQGMTWVLARFHIRIHRYPAWQEHIRIETWPSNAYSFYALRDFQVFDAQARLLVSASSLWLILDLKTRRPLRIPDYIIKMHVKERERALMDKFDAIWRPQQITLEKRFAVRRSDIDVNQHVNNVSYVAWAVETVPQELWQRSQLTEIEVSFREETMFGDTVISQSEQTEQNGQQVFTHRIIREGDGVELFLARTRWETYAGLTPPPLYPPASGGKRPYALLRTFPPLTGGLRGVLRKSCYD